MQVIKDILERAAGERQRQRHRSRWLALVLLAYLGFVVFTLLLPEYPELARYYAGSHTAVFEVRHQLAADTAAPLDRLIKSLNKAFRHADIAGIILRIDSRGGSLVKARRLYLEILRLRDEYPGVPVFSVISDACLAEAYLVALAGQGIFADKASLIGSLQPAMAYTGVSAAMKQLGVERRRISSVPHGSFPDAFQPLGDEQLRHHQGIQATLQQAYIQAIRRHRGESVAQQVLPAAYLLWTGEQAVQRGLVDRLGSTGYVAREIIGEDNILLYLPARKKPMVDILW